MLSPFKNEPFTDFSKPENKKTMEEALAKVKSELGREYPMVIDGREVTSNAKIVSCNPARKTEVVGSVHKASAKDAEDALDAAWKAFESWKQTPAEERAQCLVNFAAKMREKKHELSAWMVYEVGKSWAEADGDIAEAIDFCEF